MTRDKSNMSENVSENEECAYYLCCYLNLFLSSHKTMIKAERKKVYKVIKVRPFHTESDVGGPRRGARILIMISL